MGVISKGGIRGGGGGKRPGRACQHCDICCHTLQTRRAALPPARESKCLHLEKVMKRQWGSRRDTRYMYVCITTICRKTGVPENLLPDNPRT